MQDDKGVYYFPFPGNKNVRMYVRRTDDFVDFRLWNKEDPKLWEEHGWVSYEAIKQARAIYKGGEFNPDDAYDIELAKALLKK